MPSKPRSFYVLNFTAAPDAGPKDPYFLGQIVSTPDTAGSVSVQLLPLKDYVDSPQFLTLDAAPAAPLSGISYVNLQIAQSFAIPLSNTLKFAQFSCTENSATWSDADLPKLQGKTAAEAIAAGLTGKIVLLGDRTQTFRQQGVTSLGPYVYRDSQGAVQITKSGTIFEVNPLQLQPLSSPSAMTLPKQRIVYTLSAPITLQDNDWALVDGVGDIYLPDKPVDGFRFMLDDRKSRRLTLGRNSIVPATGATIGVGQTTATIDHRTPLTWSEADRGSFSSYIYEAGSNNWVALLTREVSGTGLSQSTVTPPILTTNAPAIAVPYQSYYLGGNGDILIYNLHQERDFIDISWDAGANWIVKVICPVGYTILGVFEDLEINTARTSATHHKLFLKAGNDFGVSA